LRSYRNLLKQKFAGERFKYFFNLIWAQALEAIEGKFVPGEHINDWCDELDRCNFTSKESARKFAKSEILHALGPYLFYKRKRSVEVFYFSYKQELAAYHVAKIKKSMLEIPEFKNVVWISPAESIIHCKWPNSKITLQIIPAGIKGAKRGPHPNVVICDDILKDPTQRKLNVAELQELSATFAEQILSMPKEGGQLHCWGTSQDPTDLFNENRKRKNFNCTVCPAIINERKKIVLWPDMFPYERLGEIRDEIRHKAFNKEYQCKPVRGEEGYFKSSEIDAVIDVDLLPISLDSNFENQEPVYGGLDLGKKRNPSHFTVFIDKDGTLIQIYEKWMDGWDYTEQLDYIKMFIEKCNMDCLEYDNTRGEFEMYAEQGQLPECMVPVAMTGKKNFELAAGFEARVRAKPKPTIVLLPDDRQRNQILAVDNDLRAPQMPDGHGDSFWSVALACEASLAGRGDYINIV